MCWICTLSTMNTLSLFDEPCTCSVGCCITCVPPTSGVDVVTPAISWPTANGFLPLAERQLGVHLRRERDREHDPFALDCAESAEREGHGVLAGPEVLDPVA